MMSSNPETLIEKARSFDQDTLGEIYDQFSDSLYSYAYKQVGDSQVAEDLVAETFKRFLIALERGGGPKEHLRAYLYRITHNLITDLYRREPPPSLELDEDRVPEDSTDPSGLISDIQEADIVRRALQLITPEQRQVIMLRFIEGWSSQEIAQVMGKSIGAVKALQHRGIASLQRILFEDAS
jgi:RNA polymerase sigma-70 factor (ECF subfamily)